MADSVKLGPWARKHSARVTYERSVGPFARLVLTHTTSRFYAWRMRVIDVAGFVRAEATLGGRVRLQDHATAKSQATRWLMREAVANSPGGKGWGR